MKNNYDDNVILIENGFKDGVDFNISCREWKMLQLNQWLNDNVMNRALALLLDRIKDSSQKYWIFNTYTMEYIIIFKNKGDTFGTRLYKRLQRGNIFEYDRFYCLCNIGNIHWALIIVNFQSKCIKYVDGKN